MNPISLLRTLAYALTFLLPAGTFVNAAQPASNPGIQRVASVEGVTEYQLANGLKVLLIADPSIDTITVNATYLVGSRNEGYGESGMAHLLEHLLFRGTAKFPNIKTELLKRGARFNGTTSNDRTNYFETFSAAPGNLDWALSIEADRMVNAIITREDLDAEMTIVRNEFESGENSPAGVLHKRVTAAAYQWHNYGRSTIGARSDIENVPIERLQAFYRTYYQPDNAVLIVAGRINEAEAIASVQKHFGVIARPARALPRTYTVEPVQDGERNVILRRVGDVQIVSAFYHLPAGAHPDHAALDVLVGVLGHTPTGRLHRSLVEAGKASSAFGWEYQQREAGYAYFGSTVRTGLPLEAARDTLIEVVENITRDPITQDEMERSLTRLLTDIEMTVANSRTLAQAMSETSAMGDWRLLFLHRDRLKKVSLADVQAVAARYFKPANRTVGMFVPTPNPDRAEAPPTPPLAEVLASYKGEENVAQGEAFDPTPDNIERRLVRRTLGGGMSLSLLPKKTRGGTVVAQLGLRWGDEAGKTGRGVSCSMASALLQRGTTQKSRQQIANEFSRLKANAGVSGDGASIQTTRENLPGALRLVAEVLRQANFPESEFEQLRTATLASLESQKSEPNALATLELQRHVNPYPPDHWLYNTSLEERLERVKNIRIEDVRGCYQELFGASDSELAVIGDFDPEEVARLAQELFGDWKSPRVYKRITAVHRDVQPLDRVIETPDKANATLRAAMSLPLKDDHPDFAALVLGNYLLGGGSDSRLSMRIREKEGLSYSVFSYLNISSLDEKAEFGVSAIHAPQNRDRVEAMMREELHRALKEGFTAEEVNAAKKGFIQARHLARGQDATLAGRLVAYMVVGRNFAWDRQLEAELAALTPEQIVAALRRHINPAKLSIIRAGDFAKKTN